MGLKVRRVLLEDVHRLFEQARREMPATLRGAASVFAGRFLPAASAALGDFCERYPEIEVELIEMLFVEPTATVLSGTIDVARS